MSSPSISHIMGYCKFIPSNISTTSLHAFEHNGLNLWKEIGFIMENTKKSVNAKTTFSIVCEPTFLFYNKVRI